MLCIIYRTGSLYFVIFLRQSRGVAVHVGDRPARAALGEDLVSSRMFHLKAKLLLRFDSCSSTRASSPAQ